MPDPILTLASVLSGESAIDRARAIDAHVRTVVAELSTNECAEPDEINGATNTNDLVVVDGCVHVRSPESEDAHRVGFICEECGQLEVPRSEPAPKQPGDRVGPDDVYPGDVVQLCWEPGSIDIRVETLAYAYWSCVIVRSSHPAFPAGSRYQFGYGGEGNPVLISRAEPEERWEDVDGAQIEAGDVVMHEGERCKVEHFINHLRVMPARDGAPVLVIAEGVTYRRLVREEPSSAGYPDRVFRTAAAIRQDFSGQDAGFAIDVLAVALGMVAASREPGPYKALALLKEDPRFHAYFLSGHKKGGK
jgi:hypothetical protein